MLGFSKYFRKPPELVAAIDLGSNSFHMIVARVTDGQLQVIAEALVAEADEASLPGAPKLMGPWVMPPCQVILIAPAGNCMPL